METYDTKYAAKVLKAINRRGGHRLFSREFEVIGKENLDKSPKDKQRLYIANHQSHADYLYAWFQFHKQGAQMPMIAAGNNLNLKLLQWMGIDFGKLGAFWIDRDKIGTGREETIAQGTEIEEKVTSLINNGNDILVFPEGGRAYDGSILKKFKPGIIKNVLMAKKNFDIINIAFAYSPRIEEEYFKILNAFKNLGKIGRTLYVATDATAFALRYLFRPESKTRINIGKPTALEIVVNGCENICDKISAIKNHSRKEIRKLYSEITN